MVARVSIGRINRPGARAPEQAHLEGLRDEELPPVIGEVWFRRGRVPGIGTDRQRVAWAKAADIDPHCQILLRVEREGVVYVEFFWDIPPEWLDGKETSIRPLLVRGLYSQPLERFLLEWEPLMGQHA